MELAIGAARAHNRGMVEFCSVDPRLLATCYVPLADLDAAGAHGRARRSPWAPPRCSWRRGARRATPPATSGSTRCGRRPARPGIPVVFHVGGTGDLIDPNYFRNGLPVPPDFHGGEENFRSVDYMGIPGPPAQTLATMIFDGVFERFPDLRVGVIEQGAIWVPSWMRQMESAFDAFARHEERLQALSLRPSEYVRRQIRFTPYPTEDVGWIIEQAGPEVCLFSSDYPHVEGGRRPIERFERSLDGRRRRRPPGLLPRQLRRPDGRRAGSLRVNGSSITQHAVGPSGAGAARGGGRRPSCAGSRPSRGARRREAGSTRRAVDGGVVGRGGHRETSASRLDDDVGLEVVARHVQRRPASRRRFFVLARPSVAEMRRPSSVSQYVMFDSCGRPSAFRS